MRILIVLPAVLGTVLGFQRDKRNDDLYQSLVYSHYLQRQGVGSLFQDELNLYSDPRENIKRDLKSHQGEYYGEYSPEYGVRPGGGPGEYSPHHQGQGYGVPPNPTAYSYTPTPAPVAYNPYHHPETKVPNHFVTTVRPVTLVSPTPYPSSPVHPSHTNPYVKQLPKYSPHSYPGYPQYLQNHDYSHPELLQYHEPQYAHQLHHPQQPHQPSFHHGLAEPGPQAVPPAHDQLHHPAPPPQHSFDVFQPNLVDDQTRHQPPGHQPFTVAPPPAPVFNHHEQVTAGPQPVLSGHSVHPNQHSVPTGPIHPQHSVLTGPIHPIQHSVPTGPIHPTQHSVPDGPLHPTQHSVSTGPIHPAHSSVPTGPIHPAHSSVPAGPNHPTHHLLPSSHPSQHSVPAAPGHPSHPSPEHGSAPHIEPVPIFSTGQLHNSPHSLAPAKKPAGDTAPRKIVKSAALLKLYEIAGDDWDPSQGIEKSLSKLQTKFQCPAPEGHFPDPQQCDVYYQCAHGTSTKYSCEAGLHWNVLTNQCDWEANVDCSINSGPVTNSAIYRYYKA